MKTHYKSITFFIIKCEFIFFLGQNGLDICDRPCVDIDLEWPMLAPIPLSHRSKNIIKRNEQTLSRLS